MDDQYWGDNTLIDATQEEKQEHLNYEIEMFRETCNQINIRPKTLFENNLLFESLPAHIRVLINFFYNDKNEKYPNDLVAQDFLPVTVNWKDERPQMTALLKEAKNKADKQVAHLSLWRVKIERDGKKDCDWINIERDMGIVIKKFEKLK
jgi:hypothetical protein